MSECHFDRNQVGLLLDGYNASNNSHGSISCSSFNHNLFRGIIIKDIDYGFTFTGCQCFEKCFIISNSEGFQYCCGLFDGPVSNINVRTNSINKLHHNMLINAYGTSIDNYSNLDLKNNSFTDGSDSYLFNN